jgi:bifunctional DNase/RNase
MVAVRVAQVLKVQGKSESLVVLVDAEGRRALPIGIGDAEAAAIALGLAHVAVPRPMTHDLLMNVIDQLGGRVERVLIHDLRGSTFIGQLEIASSVGVLEVDCRPSDGVAVAVRAGCPILVDEGVLERAGVEPDAMPPESEEPPTWD